MEQLELFPTSITYKGITLHYDVEIKKAPKKMDLWYRNMDMIKFRGKLLGYIFVKDKKGEFRFAISWINFDRQGGQVYQVRDCKSLEDSLNKKIKREIEFLEQRLDS